VAEILEDCNPARMFGILLRTQNIQSGRKLGVYWVFSYTAQHITLYTRSRYNRTNILRGFGNPKSEHSMEPNVLWAFGTTQKRVGPSGFSFWVLGGNGTIYPPTNFPGSPISLLFSHPAYFSVPFCFNSKYSIQFNSSQFFWEIYQSLSWYRRLSSLHGVET
jgi:hypothetical protein